MVSPNSPLEEASYTKILDLKNNYPNVVTLDLKNTYKWRGFLQNTLDFYQEELYKTNAATFIYMDDKQRAAQKSKLRYTIYLLMLKTKWDEAEQRRYNLKKYAADIDACNKLITRLENPNAPLEIAVEDSEKTLKFTGLTIVAQYVFNKTLEFMKATAADFSSHKTSLIDAMTFVNGFRLYWVWGGGMLSSAVNLLADDFFHKMEAGATLDAVSPISGYMSWVLYFARLGLHLMLLIKHSLNISKKLMTEKEAEVSAYERFKQQWAIHKYAILNDFFWGLANMACFFWLRGAGSLGLAGNIVTIVLLLMDLVLTVLRFQDECIAQNDKMAELNLALQKLQEELAGLDPSLQEEKLILEQRIRAQQKLIIKSELDWKYKKLQIINDIMYAAGLVFALSFIFCPPAAIFEMVTFTLCFVFNIITAAIAGELAVQKTKEMYETSVKLSDDLLNAYRDAPTEPLKRQIFLELKAANASSEYQKKLICFQQLELARSIFIDSMMPVVIFAALVFMPTGAGIGIIAAAIALALLSNLIFSKFKPQEEKLPTFDETEYKAFEANPDLSFFSKYKSSQHGLFANPKAQKLKNDGGDLDRSLDDPLSPNPI